MKSTDESRSTINSQENYYQMSTVQQAVGQRNAAVDVLPVFIFHVLDASMLVLNARQSLLSPVSVMWMGHCNSNQYIHV
jgi:hypothetical protein